MSDIMDMKQPGSLRSARLFHELRDQLAPYPKAHELIPVLIQQKLDGPEKEERLRTIFKFGKIHARYTLNDDPDLFYRNATFRLSMVFDHIHADDFLDKEYLPPDVAAALCLLALNVNPGRFETDDVITQKGTRILMDAQLIMDRYASFREREPDLSRKFDPLQSGFKREAVLVCLHALNLALMDARTDRRLEAGLFAYNMVKCCVWPDCMLSYMNQELAGSLHRVARAEPANRVKPSQP